MADPICVIRGQVQQRTEEGNASMPASQGPQPTLRASSARIRRDLKLLISFNSAILGNWANGG